MHTKTNLRIDWATHEAAEYAVLNFHYSKRMPKSKLAKFGVWEDEKFIGAVVYGVGATSTLVKSYGLKPEQGCELVRVALKSHKTSVSRILSITIKMLRNKFKGLSLIVSFADPDQSHHGGIYQAGNWIYTGKTQASDEYIFMGRRWQGRSFRNRFKGMEKDPRVTIVKGSSKYRYIMPLTEEMRQKILPLAKPYPKRAGSKDNVASGFQPEEGGAIPTSALQSTGGDNGAA